VPLILKEFFEEDILEEEVILDWAKKVPYEPITDEITGPRVADPLCCGSEMFILHPDFLSSRIPDPGSDKNKRDVGNFFLSYPFCSNKFHKMSTQKLLLSSQKQALGSGIRKLIPGSGSKKHQIPCSDSHQIGSKL
jgi:hypothetical protein